MKKGELSPMSSDILMNPFGGDDDGRVIATQSPESHLLERIKEQWVRIHYPATAR
jgi:hypothetical protein